MLTRNATSKAKINLLCSQTSEKLQKKNSSQIRESILYENRKFSSLSESDNEPDLAESNDNTKDSSECTDNEWFFSQKDDLPSVKKQMKNLGFICLQNKTTINGRILRFYMCKTAHNNINHKCNAKIKVVSEPNTPDECEVFSNHIEHIEGCEIKYNIFNEKKIKSLISESLTIKPKTILKQINSQIEDEEKKNDEFQNEFAKNSTNEMPARSSINGKL